jgi:hypothetical protein
MIRLENGLFRLPAFLMRSGIALCDATPFGRACWHSRILIQLLENKE